MPKKPAIQTAVLTKETLARAASKLTAEEEQTLRMRHGVGAGASERLERKTMDEAIADKLAQIELMAFKRMGKQVYGIGARPAAAAATARGPQLSVAPSAARNPRDKIIKALKRK